MICWRIKKQNSYANSKSWREKIYSGTYHFPRDFRFSDLVVSVFHRDYNTVSTTFSEMEGITLERYIMEYRLRRVQELLVYSNDTQSAIACKLGYSSSAHLSRQFKAHSGFSLSHFKNIRQAKLLLTHRTDIYRSLMYTINRL
ncbi:helix-turn-helix domain-containing protein [Puia sp. P3]|uniref:helix-turn-helix domain-containing protein n=1 Tax=Puia sp. P3 TaxID=3423952 RepID=UPI003D676B8F